MMTPEQRRHARLLIATLNGPVYIFRVAPQPCPHCGNNLDPRAGMWAASVRWNSTVYCSTFAVACLVAKELLARAKRDYGKQHNG